MLKKNPIATLPGFEDDEDEGVDFAPSPATKKHIRHEFRQEAEVAVATAHGSDIKSWRATKKRGPPIFPTQKEPDWKVASQGPQAPRSPAIQGPSVHDLEDFGPQETEEFY